MSRIADLGPKLQNLPSVLGEYEDALADISKNLTMVGKTLGFALKEQGTWPVYYDARRAELKALVKYMDVQVARVRGERTRMLNERSNIALGERLMGTYINADPEYLKMAELQIEVEELYERYCAACEAFTKRGFALRDLTEAHSKAVVEATL